MYPAGAVIFQVQSKSLWYGNGYPGEPTVPANRSWSSPRLITPPHSGIYEFKGQRRDTPDRAYVILKPRWFFCIVVTSCRIEKFETKRTPTGPLTEKVVSEEYLSIELRSEPQIRYITESCFTSMISKKSEWQDPSPIWKSKQDKYVLETFALFELPNAINLHVVVSKSSSTSLTVIICSYSPSGSIRYLHSKFSFG